MKYSTTSLSAITLCVCMMLSHRTNGMDMRGAPSSFTNNNPNQIQMTGQQWNQQPNTNMQFGSNNWNTAATPMHLNNNQGQSQSPEKMIIHTTVNPMNKKDITIHFSGKYRFESMKWRGRASAFRYKNEMKPSNSDNLVECYKGSERYENAKRFYDYVDRIDDPEYRRRLGDIVLRRIDSAQTDDKEMGCFVLDLPKKYLFMKDFLGQPHTFAFVKHIPSMVARVMEAVSTLNEVGVTYDSIGIDHLMVAADNTGRIRGIKLISFDRVVIHEDFRRLVKANAGLPLSPRLATIYTSFILDVRGAGVLISTLFTTYKRLLGKQFKRYPPPPSQWDLYILQQETLKKLRDSMINATSPIMVLNFMVTDAYSTINAQV